MSLVEEQTDRIDKNADERSWSRKKVERSKNNKADDETKALTTRDEKDISNAAASSGLLTWARNNFTFSDFYVAGANLAWFGIVETQIKATSRFAQNSSTSKPFELFEDFDLSGQFVATKSGKPWWRSAGLLNNRAFRFTSTRLHANDGCPLCVCLAHSLPSNVCFGNHSDGNPKRGREYYTSIPSFGRDFVAKPTHLSCSGGVWLTKHNVISDTTLISHGTKPFQSEKGFKLRKIAESLAKELHVGPQCGRQFESWALENVNPGVMIEESFTNIDAGDDDRGGMVFKVVTIWGWVWLVQWRPGTSKFRAFLRGDGSTLR